MPLPTLEMQSEAISDLIAMGWTPPAEMIQQHQHLLQPFNRVKGYNFIPGARLDPIDAENVAAIMAVFVHFNIPIPARPVEEQRDAA